MNKALKWAPVQLIKKNDNIVSSKARETGDYGFKPSYLSDPTENMRFLMSNEYMRIWFKERGKYERDTYSKEEIIKEESKIKRRFVQRMMTYKSPTKNTFLEEKVAKSLAKTRDSNQQKKVDYQRFKYKPQCLKPKEKEINISDITLEGDFKTPAGKGKKSSKKGVSKKLHHPQIDQGDKNQEVIICELEPSCCKPCPCEDEQESHTK